MFCVVSVRQRLSVPVAPRSGPRCAAAGRRGRLRRSVYELGPGLGDLVLRELDHCGSVHRCALSEERLEGLVADSFAQLRGVLLEIRVHGLVHGHRGDPPGHDGGWLVAANLVEQVHRGRRRAFKRPAVAGGVRTVDDLLAELECGERIAVFCCGLGRGAARRRFPACGCCGRGEDNLFERGDGRQHRTRTEPPCDEHERAGPATTVAAVRAPAPARGAGRPRTAGGVPRPAGDAHRPTPAAAYVPPRPSRDRPRRNRSHLFVR